MTPRLFLLLSALSAAPLAGAASLDPHLPPSGNFDLSVWKLTLPTGSGAKKADEILSPALVKGYTSQYFYTNSDGAMTFWAPVNGVTTGGTHYPRSELREMKASGAEYDWTESDGVAVLRATCSVLQAPTSTGKTVIGQIHAKSINLPLLKLAYDRGQIVALVKKTSKNDEDTPYKLGRVGIGEKVNYEIRLDGDALTISANGVSATVSVAEDWRPVTFYFKAGNYVQATGDSSTDGGRVAFYSIEVGHTPFPK